MKREQAAIDEYLRQLSRVDPEVAEEVEKRQPSPGLESVGGEMAMETIVLEVGRPVLDIRDGAAKIEIEEPESQVWKARLENAADSLAPTIQAIGRIEVVGHPRFDWIGTGWLVRDDVVVTNRHVAELFCRLGTVGFEFRPGLGGGLMQSRIDFLEEFGSDAAREFPLFKILHIEDEPGPDLAFFRVEPSNENSPSPVILAAQPAVEQTQIAVVGYPARDPFFPDQDLMNRIFRNRFDKKRLAPGLVTEVSAGQLLHDCSTLGGNSGAAVVSLADGAAVALHFAGTLFTKNHAVDAETVGNRLEDVLAGRVSPIGRTPEDKVTLTSPIASPQIQLQAVGQGPSGVLTATIPIHVQIAIGDAETAISTHLQVDPSVHATSPATDGGDDDLLAETEARPEDLLDREGFADDFLGDGFETPLPMLTDNQDDTLTFDFDGCNREVLTYRHFSVLMSRSRRLCRYSACNIDGNLSQKRKRKGWRWDPRIPHEAQIRKECYGNQPKFSRGHMTRREDPVWGSDEHASDGNVDSMYVTNAVPQIQPFNAGIWLGLEDYALDHTRDDDMKICVFTGPFFEDGDPELFGVKIPIAFWKVIAFIHDQTNELSATGYVMSQESFLGGQEFVFGQHESSQRPITEIEQRAGLSFGPLAAADPMAEMQEGASRPLASFAQVQFH